LEFPSTQYEEASSLQQVRIVPQVLPAVHGFCFEPPDSQNCDALMGDKACDNITML